MEYVLFKCTKCESFISYPSWTADGGTCNRCNGFIIPKDKGTKQELIDKHGDSIVFNGKKAYPGSK